MVSFMFPHYCDTPQTLADTVAFMKRLVDRYLVVVLGFNTSVPNHVGYHMFKDEFALQLGANDEIVSTKYVNAAQIAMALMQASALTRESTLKNSLQVIEATGNEVGLAIPPGLGKLMARWSTKSRP